jgi:putative nucleotidyltransferase with HDIG domain
MPERAIRHFRDFIGRVRSSDFQSLPRFLHSTAFSWLMLFVLTAVVAYLTSMSLQHIPPELKEGMIAARDIKADRNYEIVDEEATAKFRDEAAAGVLPVYDFDPRVAESIVSRIRGAFEAVRARQSELLSGAGLGRLSENQERELRDLFSTKLGVTLQASQWNALVSERFSERAESLLIWLIRQAMGRPVIAERSALDAQKGKGVVLRLIKGEAGAEGEAVYEDTIVEDVSKIISTDKAKRQIADLEIPRRGLRSPQSASVILGLAQLLVEPNCALNRTETQRRRDVAAADVKEVILKVKAGEMIIREGARYEPWHIKVLSGIQKERRRGTSFLQFMGTFLLILVVLLLSFYLAERFFRRVRPTRSDHYLMAFVGLSIVIIIRLGLFMAPAIHGAFYLDITTSALRYAIPVAGGAMLLRMYLGAEITLVFAVVMSMLAGLFVESDVQFVTYCLAANFAAVISIAKVDRRSLIIRAGAITGGVGAMTVVCMNLVAMAAGGEAFGAAEFLWSAFFAFLGGIGASIYTMIAAPLVESITGYTSDIKLLELANLNHPLLRELIVRAPGTYHHSHLLGILGEAAAEAIGANTLLVRVGAYYHDIGKIKKPQYFVENVRGGEDKHERLSPHMSALIVAAHIKDGVEMAAQAGIPRVITDMIPQHHGTRLIGYFYDKAKSQEVPSVQKIDSKEFKYPGPKPQSREAAILMLADVTEAAVRSLKEKSSTRIQQTVQRVINDIFAEAQLDECDLTLRDLNEIARAFVRILLGIYHQRIEYPKDAERENEKQDINFVDQDSTGADSDRKPPSTNKAKPKGG